MAAAPKQNLGKMPCPCCGDSVALRKSATGKLSYACQDADCESTGFADQHSGAARKWLASLTGAAPAAPAPAKAAPAARTAHAATLPPAPVAKTPPRPAFDIGAV